MNIIRNHTRARMSQIVIHGNTIYLAGQVASDTNANISVQTEQVLESIDQLLPSLSLMKLTSNSVTVANRRSCVDRTGSCFWY